LEKALTEKSKAWDKITKIGRTHLMDATPIRVGQVFGGYAAQIKKARKRCAIALEALSELAIGGTAVGTGINTHPKFGRMVAAELTRATGVKFREARNHPEAQATKDGFVQASGEIKTIAISLSKIANDIRWLGSGPRCGLAELSLPATQPGSSIMPGKVNPVICEAVAMACVQVVGNDAAVTMAGASGAFEITVMMPVMARNVLESVDLLASSARLLADKVVDGIVPDRARMRAYAEASPAIATALNPYLGYEAVAAVVKQALADGTSIREAVVTRGHVERGEITTDQLDAALDVDAMARPVEPAG
jgi:fumarate hydratase class II